MRGQAARGHTLTILLSVKPSCIFHLHKINTIYRHKIDISHHVIYSKEQSIFSVIKVLSMTSEKMVRAWPCNLLMKLGKNKLKVI